MSFLEKKYDDSPQIRAILNTWLENSKEMPDDDAKEYLLEYGVDEDSALIMLSAFKSEEKYGYPLYPSHAHYIIRLAKENKKTNPLFKIIQTPFLLAKVTWIYDHAPFFLLHHNLRLLSKRYPRPLTHRECPVAG